MRACLWILCFAACAGKAPPDDRFDDGKSDMFSAKMKLLGALAPGDTSVDYNNPPRYRAFTLPAGEIDVWVRSSDGDAVAWLTDGNFKVLARNDDASSSTFDAHVQAPTAAYLIFREYSQAAAHFTVSLLATAMAGDRGPAQIIEWNGTRQHYRHDYHYDAEKRLSSIEHLVMMNGSWTPATVNDYSRDAAGKIATVTESTGGKPDSVTSYEYDSSGRLIAQKTRYLDAAQTPIDTIRYEYSAQFKMTLWAHGSNTPDWDTLYQFSGDQLTEATASYYPDGSLARFSFRDSQLGSDGKLTEQSYRTQLSGPVLGTSSYFYDASGRIDHIDEIDAGKMVTQTRYRYTANQTTRQRFDADSSGALSQKNRSDITWTDAGTSAAFSESDPTPVKPWAVDDYGSGAYFTR